MRDTCDEPSDAIDDELPLEVLERRLTTRAAEMAAAEAEWMMWLAEYDRRRGWAEWGCSGPAHWLSWKCGFSPSAAHERVRVANALTDLPLIQAEYAAGRISYSKVQALTRVANEHNEPDLIHMAVQASGAQLSRICAGYRASKATSDDAVKTAFASRAWGSRRHHDGTSTITLRVTDDALRQVDDRLDAVVRDIIDDAIAASSDDGSPSTNKTRRDAIAERGGLAAIRADAAVLLLTGEAERTEPTPADVALIVDADQVDAANTATDLAVADGPAADSCAQESSGVEVHQSGQAVAQSTAERLLCDPRVHAIVESASSGVLAVGRSTRIISRRMRRALERRDHGGCQFHGCHATKRLHAHHIIHWANGGPTELDNLILVCHFHHHLVHEGGWSVDPETRTFRRPDGTALNDDAELLRAGVAGEHIAEPATWPTGAVGPLEPPEYGPFDLPWTTVILHHNEAMRRKAASRD